MSPKTPEPVLLRVRVQPKARANAVRAGAGRRSRVSVTAAPEDGKANRAVIALLADDVRRRRPRPSPSCAAPRRATSGSACPRARTCPHDRADPLGAAPPPAPRPDAASRRGESRASTRAGRTSPTPSAPSSSAGRRPSAAPPPSAWRWPPARARRPTASGSSPSSRRRSRAWRPRGPRRSTSSGRSSACAASPRRTARSRWPALRERLLAEAQAILDEDVAANRALGAHGAALVPDGARILTHCNAGALATAGYGTALGVIRAAHEQGRVALVWVDETRPVHAGRAAHGLGDGARGHPAPPDLGRGGGRRHEARRGRPRRRRRGPHRRQRRHRQQDRHLLGRGAGPSTTASRSTSRRRSRPSTPRSPSGADIPIEERERRRGPPHRRPADGAARDAASTTPPST